jgi:hypothetical protein
MDKVRVDVIGDPAFFAQVSEEAARLDRSNSWIVQRCLLTALPALAKLAADSDEVSGMKLSPLRNPVRLASLRANLAMADSSVPAVAELASVPKGTEQRMFFMPRDMYEAFDREAERLKLSADELLMWAWKHSGDSVRSLPSVSDE